jgi:hypothetical protein
MTSREINTVTASRDDKGEGRDFYWEPSGRMDREKQQVPPLRSPGFPVEVGGVGGRNAAFLTESRTRSTGECRVAGNPGTLRSG